MNKLYLFALGALLVSCGGRTSVEDGPLVFEENAPLSALASIAESVKLIPLENDGEHFLGDNAFFYMSDGEFFIEDHRNIFRFSADGKFLNSIGRQGSGPKEYHSISNVQPIGEEVLIFCQLPDKIQRFRKDGTFISEEKPVMALGSQSYEIHGGIFTYRGFGSVEGCRASFLKDGVVTDFLPSTEKVLHLSPFWPLFSEHDGKLFFADTYRPVVRTFDGKEITDEFTVDLGKYAIDESFFENDDAMQGASLLFESAFGLITFYQETDDLKYVQVTTQNNEFSGTSEAVNTGKGWIWFCGGRPGEDPFAGTCKAVSGKSLYFLLDAALIGNFPDELRPLLTDPGMLGTISEDSNGVIAEVRLK